MFYTLPTQQCEVYALCGAYGSCSLKSSCVCLPGFKPKLQSDWDLKDYSSGCVRKTKLQCGNNTLKNGERDRFLEMPNMLMVEYKHPLEAGSLEECEAKCLNNCSCTTYDDDIGCSIWMEDLLNLKKLGDGDNDQMTLHLRLVASNHWKLKRSSLKWKLYAILFGILAAAMLTSCIAFFASYRRRKNLAINKRGK